jgi:predicted transcriptional regulator
MKVKDIVFTKAPPVSKNDLAVRARALMRQNSVRALPVFDNEKLIGVITRSDLVKITSTKSNITVGGLLWKPLITADAESDIFEAAKILLKEDMKQIPVTGNSKYIGMVRDIDILQVILDRKLKPKKKSVRDIMTSRVRIFASDESISKVWSSIAEHSAFPVIQAGRIVGIISTKELLDSRSTRIERESKAIKNPTKVGHTMRILIGREGKFIVPPDSAVEKAIKKMLDEDLSILIVAENFKKLIGIVTRKDLLKAYV